MQTDCTASLILVLSKVSNWNRKQDFKDTAYHWPCKMSEKSSVGPMGTMWPAGWAKARDRRGLQPSWGPAGNHWSHCWGNSSASSVRATSIYPAKATLGGTNPLNRRASVDPGLVPAPVSPRILCIHALEGLPPDGPQGLPGMGGLLPPSRILGKMAGLLSWCV